MSCDDVQKFTLQLWTLPDARMRSGRTWGNFAQDVLCSHITAHHKIETHLKPRPGMNEELINSAVSFLQDLTVASSPINKKIEFLQSKGLNEGEIEEAIKRAKNGTSSSTNSSEATNATTYKGVMQDHPPNSHNFPPLDYYSVAPQVPERTWKDYFIMATATAGVTYGFYQVVSRYLLPSIIPPGKSRLDDDKQVIEEEFLKIDKVLEQMALEQKEIKDANEAKLSEIDGVIDKVNDFLSKYNKDKLKFDDDLRLMKFEVDSLQNSIEKNMKLTKENIRDELSDISDELESLKSLIKARGGSTGAAERKVAPVSSIPSASEILKKAKSNGSSAAPNTSKNAATKAFEPSVDQATETQHSFSILNTGEATETSTTTRPRVPSFSANKDFLAAGIPNWQLAHKKKEEEEGKGASQEASADQAKKHGNTDNNQKVEESILRVGVPQWQLNASST